MNAEASAIKSSLSTHETRHHPGSQLPLFPPSCKSHLKAKELKRRRRRVRRVRVPQPGPGSISPSHLLLSVSRGAFPRAHRSLELTRYSAQTQNKTTMNWDYCPESPPHAGRELHIPAQTQEQPWPCKGRAMGLPGADTAQPRGKAQASPAWKTNPRSRNYLFFT